MKKTAFIYIITAGILWGTSGIFVKLLSPYGFSSLQMTAMRATVSFIFMAIYILASDRKKISARPSDLIIYAGMGLSIFGTASCYFLSMQATSISTAVVLMYTAPIYVTVFSAIFFGEKFSPSKIVSIVLMLVGCALVSGIVGGLKFNVFGILIGVLSGISYGAYNVITKISARRGLPTQSATLYSFLFMSLISLAVSSPKAIVELAIDRPIITVPLILGIGIVTCVLPYFLYGSAMKELPAGTAASLGIVEPMAACIFSLFLGEKIGLFAIIGIILILFAVFLLGRTESESK